MNSCESIDSKNVSKCWMNLRLKIPCNSRKIKWFQRNHQKIFYALTNLLKLFCTLNESSRSSCWATILIHIPMNSRSLKRSLSIVSLLKAKVLRSAFTWTAVTSDFTQRSNILCNSFTACSLSSPKLARNMKTEMMSYTVNFSSPVRSKEVVKMFTIFGGTTSAFWWQYLTIFMMFPNMVDPSNSIEIFDKNINWSFDRILAQFRYFVVSMNQMVNKQYVIKWEIGDSIE